MIFKLQSSEFWNVLSQNLVQKPHATTMACQLQLPGPIRYQVAVKKQQHRDKSTVGWHLTEEIWPDVLNDVFKHMTIRMYAHVEAYVYTYYYVDNSTYSIMDMRGCQLALAEAHVPAYVSLLSVLSSSCLCLRPPKKGPDPDQKWGRNLIAIQESEAQLPNWTATIDVVHFCFFSRGCQDAGFTVLVHIYMYFEVYIYTYYIYIHTYNIYIYTIYTYETYIHICSSKTVASSWRGLRWLH
jgi:hypothetical protein